MTRRLYVRGAWVLVIIAALAMYAVNPYHVRSLDPRPRILGFQPFRMPSQSMEPTVHENVVFLVNVVTLRDRDPRVGEIVAFRYPPRPDVIYLKRVIAAGGMTVEMRHGVVWLDGKPLAEPYLPSPPIREARVGDSVIAVREDYLFYDLPPVQVPAGQFFVLGDNRGNSEDSRSYGFIPRDLVVGSYVKIL